MVAALVVGSALGMAGALLQGMLRNRSPWRAPVGGNRLPLRIPQPLSP
ncbi:MAG: hypothetical protein MJA27_21015 [Pseudanabaenales cyanobacterium]|nr:hypothetical protein [Pseudanabaenales cyanobacterium]